MTSSRLVFLYSLSFSLNAHGAHVQHFMHFHIKLILEKRFAFVIMISIVFHVLLFCSAINKSNDFVLRNDSSTRYDQINCLFICCALTALNFDWIASNNRNIFPFFGYHSNFIHIDFHLNGTTNYKRVLTANFINSDFIC